MKADRRSGWRLVEQWLDSIRLSRSRQPGRNPCFCTSAALAA